MSPSRKRWANLAFWVATAALAAVAVWANATREERLVRAVVDEMERRGMTLRAPR